MDLPDATPPIGRFVEVDGRRLWVDTREGPGPCAVFLPGSGEMGLDLWQSFDRVTQSRAGVIYDRGGTGWSSPVALPRAAAAVAGELEALLRALGVQDAVVLVGHSLGGAYAQRFAQLFPDRVAGMVLLDPVHGAWNAAMPERLRIKPNASTSVVVTDEHRAAARRWRESVTTDLPPQICQLVRDRHAADDLETGPREGANFVEILDELGPGPFAAPTIVLRAGTVDPLQAQFSTADDLRERAAALRHMYEAALPAGSQSRELSTATHSDIALGFAEDVAAAVREIGEATRGRGFVA
ncbi:alpha/beta fold hydrolase [Microbacterium trichothecenolyticum]|uniref:Pimeloyl-ACP methyl ester carboxylesterase n=1 Tax=Microbacterium trichothecenolyticum TaxID=69370 RepID=A0ABU0TTY9_MICTR|nr:alpha/beta hydrolase [Microbacterium trichothecenolyticum]MDQ1123128.1 pimeloyl-ACP methyl ester carboxylesterase [Microbacterium trichothecenolyticum]